ALVAMAVTAAGALLVEIVATTLLQRIVPDAIRGRTIGAMDTLSVTAYASGAFVIPILAAKQPAIVLIGCAVAIAGTSLVALVLIGHWAIQQPAADDVRRRLAEVPMFAGLAPARLETAMRHATLRPMTAGEVVIRQGDEADYFYVIDRGIVEVTHSAGEGQGDTVLRQMGSGEFFGEIGLLSRVPRTATVTAESDGSLIALDREAFLELVESGPGLTHRLLDVHRGVVTTGAAASATGHTAQA
ncbi:MAG: cyclic nucleotide-binding domain-containing protein, partial [Candidatus Limnocylindrales bacterium]